jgi:hypothetical protein
MGLENLTQLDILNGIFAIMFIIFSFIIGFKLIYKYFSHRRIEIITIGLTWIFLSSAWWGIGILFSFYVLFDYRIGTVFYLLIGNIFVPLAIMCWIYSFSNMVYPTIKKRIILVYSVICILYEVFLIIFLITDPGMIGTFETEFYLTTELYPTVFQIFSVLTAIITGILFTRNALRSNDPKVQWKGRFLLLAFTAFTIASFFEAIILLDPLTLVIMRTILIFSAIIYYLGFFLPERVSNWLISPNNKS